MAAFISPSFITELLAHVDIVELIGSRIEVRKKGANYGALCPFHNEKTPSFSISPSKQFYHCFGCGAHGNAINFLMAYDRLEFVAAVETLATNTGLTVAYTNSQAQPTAHKNLYSLLECICDYYQKQLQHCVNAMRYLTARGLSQEIIKQYRIGFAPQGWEIIWKQFGQQKARQQQLLTSGMVIKKSAQKYYDRFRGRIMFPILDLRGRIIGFGGRSLGDGMPKYLNSPETPIFHKGNELYGLYQARKTNAKLEYIIVVEGYMDVVSLAQHEINNAVATLGTAMNARHMQRLYRYTAELVFCFDADQAGKKAAWQALELLLPILRDGIQARFMFLPEGEDPDSYVQKHGKLTFKAKIQQAITFSDFFFSHLMQQTDIKTMAGKAKFAQIAGSLINKMPTSIFQELMLEQLAAMVGIATNQLQQYAQPSKLQRQQPVTPLTVSKSAHLPYPVRLTIALLVQHPKLANTIQYQTQHFSTDIPGIQIITKLLEIIRTQPHITMGSLLEYWRDGEDASLIAQLATWEHLIPKDGLTQELQGSLRRIAEIGQEQAIQSLLSKARQTPLNEQEKRHLQTLIANKNKADLED